MVSRRLCIVLLDTFIRKVSVGSDRFLFRIYPNTDRSETSIAILG